MQFKLVPLEPTDEMIVAFAEAWYSKRQTIDDPDMLDAYREMLAVAPQPDRDEQIEFEIAMLREFLPVHKVPENCTINFGDYIASSGEYINPKVRYRRKLWLQREELERGAACKL